MSGDQRGTYLWQVHEGPELSRFLFTHEGAQPIGSLFGIDESGFSRNSPIVRSVHQRK